MKQFIIYFLIIIWPCISSCSSTDFITQLTALALQGNSYAQLSLANCYRNGINTPIDLFKFRYFLELSVSNNNIEAIKLLKSITPKPNEIKIIIPLTCNEKKETFFNKVRLSSLMYCKSIPDKIRKKKKESYRHIKLLVIKQYLKRKLIIFK